MSTREEDVEASALRQRGMVDLSDRRYLRRDRNTVRAYVSGKREAGTRRPAAPDPLERFVPYLAARLRSDDPHA